MNRFDDLKVLDLRSLSDSLAARTPAVSELAPGEWLSIVQVLTASIIECCGELSSKSWATCSAAVTYALEAAVASGYIDHREAVIRRLNLTAALLQHVRPSAEVDLLDPRRAVELFLGEVPMSADEARGLAVDWRSLDISLIRTLRATKNLVTPVLLMTHTVFGNDFDVRVKAWENVLPLLP